ncbi:MAG: secretin N-terminal domain-containing protein [Campylobacterota bacterium]|nr:secretin N-terminal domain-containing protein [Campylobacterota bacterium]
MKHYFALSISLIFFVSCTQTQPQIENKPNEAFQEFQYQDTFYGDSRSNASIRKARNSTKNIERIPDFQEKEFQSIKTNNRKNIKKEVEVSGGEVKVNVESIPLYEFIDLIFSNVLKMNYTVDKNVKKMKQPITLNMARPLPTKQVLAVVKNILKNESVSFSQKDGMLFIAPSSRRSASKVLSDRYLIVGREISSSLKEMQKVLVFTPIEYLTPKEIAKYAQRLGVTNVEMAFLSENILSLKGEAFYVRQILELIKIIDSPSLDKKVPYVLELEHIDVEKFTKRMKSILQSNAIPVATNIREVGMVLTPVNEINRLLILSPKKSWVKMVNYWKNKLDVLSEVDTEHSQLYIYKVKHRKADEFAEVLSSVLTVEESSTDQAFSANSDANQTLGKSQTELKIKSDLHTNTLMLNVTPAQYKQMLPIIKKLDHFPLQVVVDVTLAEVTMTDTFSLGFEWALLNNKAAEGTPIEVSSGAYDLTLGGSGLASTLFTTNLTSIINTYAETKMLEILSQPRLVILNNKVGNINIGQEIPVLSSEIPTEGVTGSLNPVQNISYVPTGMTLNITPTINSNGSLNMDIEVTLSEAQTNSTSGIDSPLIVNRSLTTSAVMQSGNSILLGGMIAHNKSNGDSGVPVLKDLPWIGDIFQSQSENFVKTELIILIRPRILRNTFELYKETNKFRLLLKNLRKSVVF